MEDRIPVVGSKGLLHTPLLARDIVVVLVGGGGGGRSLLLLFLNRGGGGTGGATNCAVYEDLGDSR